MSTLGDRLRTLRGSTSQGRFSAPLGMKYQQYARYESGETIPGADVIEKICRIHCCSADWLLGLEDVNKGSINAQNSAITIGSNSFAVLDNNSSVVNDGKRESCDKCPYKSKLKALQKLLQVD